MFTRVLGTVLLEGNGTIMCGQLRCSGACWVEEGGRWIRAAAGRQWNPLESPASTMRMLITESGRFSVNGVSFRDFTDVGIENINKTYEFAIEHMTRKISINRY
jgi:hypothetical protein